MFAEQSSNERGVFHSPEGRGREGKVKEPPTPPTAREGEFPMDLDWEPSGHFSTLARQAGAPAPHRRGRRRIPQLLDRSRRRDESAPVGPQAADESEGPEAPRRRVEGWPPALTVKSVRPWKAFLNATMPLLWVPNLSCAYLRASFSAASLASAPSYRKRPFRQTSRRSVFWPGAARGLVSKAVAGMPELLPPGHSAPDAAQGAHDPAR